MTTDPRNEYPLLPEQKGLLGRFLWVCMNNPLLPAILLGAIVAGGVAVAPFDWDTGPLPRYPVATDAIPGTGENQQIVFSAWPGRSPQDVDDQISFPISVAMQGLHGVKTVRSYSMFGLSMVYVIFDESIGFYDSRTRILEKLASLSPEKDYPGGVRPQLGPEATALGQIFWYTLEGRDPEGNPIGGWDLDELRTLQDWQVRYALSSAGGVAEVASIGGFVQEYQVDVDPDALRAYGVTLPEVIQAVRDADVDVGAGTMEVNRVEYFVRSEGSIQHARDIAKSVIKVNDGIPILVDQVAEVKLGPAPRRGVLDKAGAEAVGGVVVARYGENPLATIENVKRKIEQIAPSLPRRAVIDYQNIGVEAVTAYAKAQGFAAFREDQLNQEAWLEHLRETPREQWPRWVNISQVTIEPFYDRTGLIYETLGTLGTALSHEVLVTLIVVILMVLNLRASVLIGSMLPLAILLCFIAMKLFGVDANIVALSGIAIAIGTIVDMGIVVCENILRHLDKAPPEEPRRQVVHRATSEVGSAVMVAVATTVVSFLPVLAMTGPEGKLFKPLAYTKTFALIASILLAIVFLPAAAELFFTRRSGRRSLRRSLEVLSLAAGAGFFVWALRTGSVPAIIGSAVLILLAAAQLASRYLPARIGLASRWITAIAICAAIAALLASHWSPLGIQAGPGANFAFVAVLIGGLLGFFRLFQWAYLPLLGWLLKRKALVVLAGAVILIFGAMSWLGFDRVFGFVPAAAEAVAGKGDEIRRHRYWVNASQRFSGLGKEFMPPLDEGSYLYMPTTMTHASLEEAQDILAKQDMAFEAIAEISSAVGKIGRAETPLDPAPISMVETIINYHSEFVTDAAGHVVRFRYEPEGKELARGADGRLHQAPDGKPYYVPGRYGRDEKGRLIPDPQGREFRNWRRALDPDLNPGRQAWPGITSPEDIWDQIVQAGQIEGTTSAPKLQPIAARRVMLQSGMRAPMGVRIQGPDLETIQQVAQRIEKLLKEVPGVRDSAVNAERIVGKSYRTILPDRDALGRYKVRMGQFQDIVEVAIGGRPLASTIQQRQRIAIRVRYLRELRDSLEDLRRILVPGDRAQVPLEQVARVADIRGPQVIKSEDAFLVGYVLFDKEPDQAEVDVVQRAQAHLSKELSPDLPRGVSFEFAGDYQNQIRSRRTLAVVLPGALAVIFLLLHFQFRSVPTTLLVFTGIFIAWSGGFILLWLYGQGWFLDVTIRGTELRDLFQIAPRNLSVAVWVGFLALFGIATDDGVVQATYLSQVFRETQPTSIAQARKATLQAASRRIRPCLMTSATTILALVPVLTSTGRGSDVMVPMAIPSFGGMILVLFSLLLVPALYCWGQERKIRRKQG